MWLRVQVHAPNSSGISACTNIRKLVKTMNESRRQKTRVKYQRTHHSKLNVEKLALYSGF